MAGMVFTFSAASEQLDLSAKRRVVLRDLEGSTPSLRARKRRENEKGYFVCLLCVCVVREREREAVEGERKRAVKKVPH